MPFRLPRPAPGPWTARRLFNALNVPLIVSMLTVLAPTPNGAEGLRFGFARRMLTPDLERGPVFMAGFGNNRRATGVHDDLWARAMAVSDGERRVVVVAVDLIGVFLADVERARVTLGERVGPTTLIVSSSHNHEGPDTLGLWGPGRFTSGVDPAYLARVRNTIVESAEAALAALRPGRLVLARTRTPELIMDGRLPEVVADELVVLQMVAEDGGTLGTVVSWGSHPEALGGDNTEITADFPHYLCRRLEESLGGTAVFLVGSIGGLMTPLGLDLSDAGGRPIPKDSFALARAVGERAATAALRALAASGRESVSYALEYRSAPVFVPLENRLLRLATVLGVLDRRVYSDGEPATAVLGDDLRTEIGILTLGDAQILCVPGEIYPELVIGGIQDPQDPAADYPGAPPETTLDSLLEAEFRIVMGLANDEIGYILPRSQWDTEPPFAYGLEEAQYGEVNSVGPGVAPILAEAFSALVRGGRRDRSK